DLYRNASHGVDNPEAIFIRSVITCEDRNAAPKQWCFHELCYGAALVDMIRLNLQHHLSINQTEALLPLKCGGNCCAAFRFALGRETIVKRDSAGLFFEKKARVRFHHVRERCSDCRDSTICRRRTKNTIPRLAQLQPVNASSGQRQAKMLVYLGERSAGHKRNGTTKRCFQRKKNVLQARIDGDCIRRGRKLCQRSVEIEKQRPVSLCRRKMPFFPAHCAALKPSSAPGHSRSLAFRSGMQMRNLVPSAPVERSSIWPPCV